MTETAPQRYLVRECETKYLARHGDSYLGVGYTKSAEEAAERYEIMLSVVRDDQERVSVLDLGCGLAHMLDHINAHPEWSHVRYTGLDASQRYLQAARARHPDAELIELDILEGDATLPEYDYVLMNGIFNTRGSLSQGRMVAYWKRMVAVAFSHARRGLAFNVMTKYVDWERDDLFHLPLETMGRFVAGNLSRHFVVRHDYDAYEYTVYVYRSPYGR